MAARRLSAIGVLIGSLVASATALGAFGAVSASAAGAGPTALTATVSSSYRVTLKWTTGTESKDQVERATTATGPWTKTGRLRSVSRAGYHLSYRDVILPYGTYYYRVVGTAVGVTDVMSSVVGPVVVGPTTPTTGPPTTPPTTVPSGVGPIVWNYFSTKYVEQGVGVAVDRSGNLTLAASISDRIDFGNGMIGATGTSAVGLTQYAPNGTARWSFHLPGSVAGLAVDGNDLLALAGTFSVPVDFGNGTVAPAGGGIADMYVAKYRKTSAKALEWVRKASIPGGVTPQAVAADAAGNVAVAGFFSGNTAGETLSIEGSSATLHGDQSGVRNGFVIVYSNTGSVVFAKSFSGTGAHATTMGVAFTGNGAVAVTGYFRGRVDFGGQQATSVSNTEDIFIAGLSASGGLQWLKSTGDTDHDRGTAIASDASGNVAVTGYFGGTANFGGAQLVNPTFNGVMERDAFLVKYSASGAHLWSKNFTAPTASYNATLAQGIAFDRSGNVLLTGAIVNAIDFGGGPLSGSNSNDVFLAKFSPAGSHVWSTRSGSVYDDRGRAITADTNGNIVATGVKTNTASASIDDVFLATSQG